MSDENTQNQPTAEQMENVTITAGSEAETYHADTSDAGEGDLLAGKFKSQDDLVQAYKELEQKLGQKSQQPAEETTSEEDDNGSTDETNENTEDTTDDDQENPYGPVVSEALKAAELNIDDVRNEWSENGQLGDETFEAFEKAGFPRAMVESYLRGLQASTDSNEAAVAQQVADIKASVGGDEEFTKVQKFIGNNYTMAEAQAYNEAIQSGDVAKAKTAVQQAHQRYLAEIGVEGRTESGGKTATGTQGYASEAEMMADMAKPEYKTSQAFRDKVAAKIDKSSFFRTR